MSELQPDAGGYHDRWISCTPTELQIRGYYLPWGPFGTKRVPYRSIRSVERREIGALSGRGRIWGTGNPRYWLNFDPDRPRKTIALVLDVGGFVHPFITPDDPDAVLAAIRAHGGPGASEDGLAPPP